MIWVLLPRALDYEETEEGWSKSPQITQPEKAEWGRLQHLEAVWPHPTLAAVGAGAAGARAQ